MIARPADASGAAPTDAGGLRVSVVVPVYNPGRYLDRCLASLRSQTMPPDAYEVVFVDDGSTDGTADRLDALAATDPRWRVVHIPNSGWPGRPRNVGVEAARGDYVQFVDQDDAISPEALEALHAFGVRNGSDIVIGKVASNFRGVPQGLLGRTRAACTIRDAPLIDSLTPHKMFRRSFLQEHGIAFPEGRRRLEDQLFMVRAYFRAATVSILADRVYYFYARRDDGGNAGSTPIDPPGYYANLGEVLDVVHAEEPPGELRDRLLRRFLRVEVLGRLSEPSFVRHPPDVRDALCAAAGHVVRERIPPSVDAGLPGLLRVRAGLLRDDRRDELLTLAQRCASVTAVATLESAAWRGPRLEIRATVGLHRAGEPLRMMVADGRRLLDPALTHDLGAEALDVTDDAGEMRLTLAAVDRETGAEWPIRALGEVSWEAAPTDGVTAIETPTLAMTAQIDPLRLAAGQPLGRGTWEIRARVTGFGLDRRTVIRAPDAPAPGGGRVSGAAGRPTAALLGNPSRVVSPRLEEDGPLVLDVAAGLPLGGAGRWARVLRDGTIVEVWVPMHRTAQSAPLAVALMLRDGAGRGHPWTGHLVARGPAVVLVGRAGRPLASIARGEYELCVVSSDPAGGTESLGAIRIGRRGRATALGAWRAPLGERIGWRRREASLRVRRGLRGIRRRLSRLAPNAGRLRAR